MSTSDSTASFDIAVIGGGPGGAAAAIDAARAGHSVALIERDKFPRFHIGESLTGEVSKAVRSWGLEDEVAKIGHVSKQGTYVFGSSAASFYIPVMGLSADGNSRVPTSTWQVDRADFDQMLLRCATDSGAELVQGTATKPLFDADGAVVGVQVSTADGDREIHARCTIDASGQGRFMQKQKLAGDVERGKYSKQLAFYTHLEGVDRSELPVSNNTRIFYAGPNRWGWLIPVNDTVTSVGIVQPSEYYRSTGDSPEAFVEREMRELHPELARLCETATVTRPVESAHNFSYQIRDFTGPGWLAVGDAHRFVDPIFSLGVCCAILEGRRAAEICGTTIEQDLSPTEAHAQLFRPYEEWADAGIDILQELIDAFWGNPIGFGYLAHRKHHDDIVDIFAGRFYGTIEPSEGLLALRRLVQSVGPA